MKELSTPSSSDHNNNDNAFKALTDVTEKLSQGRNDNVAIIAIIGLVFSFMTMICIAGFVYTDGNRQPNHIPQVSTTQPD
ncbi:hypothetical protein [Crocosphaera sp.]|uniref:hypothetical protein n=1 Tax=Crocosphaera sp. TaxID=2729996 RepID=UPI003F257E29|nr:hypothetical protein [Crocosphaera sp.]